LRSPDSSSGKTAKRSLLSQRVQGIVLMCLVGVCFSSIDAAGKFLNHLMPTMEVVWARFLGAFIFSLAISQVVVRPQVVRTRRPVLQIVRATLLLAANIFNLISLRYLQLDQMLSIMFTVPFIVAIAAVPLLGERIGPRRWAAIGVGFAGVLVVTRPGAGGIHPAALLTLMAAITYSLYSIVTRLLAPIDSSATTLFYTNLVGAVAMSLVVPFLWVTPEPMVCVIMVVMAGLAVLGHFLLILAHRLTPASILAPFMYTQLVWMVIYGYAIFGDLPNQWTLTGAAIVIASGLYLFNRERKVKGPEAPVSGDTVA
jgi:drug/metabolite transporter (DMT)-like permease